MSSTVLSHGPFLGNITSKSVKVWFRSSRQREETFVVRLYLNQDEVDFTEVSLKKENDFVGLAFFENLKDTADYCIKVYLNEKSVGSLDCKTKSKQSKSLHFTFGSCRYNHWHNSIQNDAVLGDETFKKIIELHDSNQLDFSLFLGDQIYADPTYSVGISEKFEDFSTTYQDAFSQPYFHKLLSKVPTYMVLDDHEIRDNWSRDMLESFSFFENREGIYKNGLKTYEIWQHSRNPETEKGQYWYNFEEANIPFFIMDIRTNRVINPRGNKRKTILGDEQLGALFEWLYESKNQAVRFIGSGVPFCPDHVKKEDKWCEFEDERNLILEFIRVENIGKTVFLSGDVHIGMFSRMSCVQDDSFEVYNLVSSPFYWPYRGMYVREFFGDRRLSYNQWTDKRRMYRNQYDYDYKTESWLRENQFGEVLVNEDGSGSVRHFNMKSESYEEWYNF